MVGNMTSAQLGQWNQDFLIDLGVKSNQYSKDLPFLQAWENREGIGNLATYNPLGTTMQGYGGSPVPGQSAGVMAYPDIASGAAANAAALMGNNAGYSQLVQGFQQGNLNTNATYQGLQTWSGPNGYNTLTGIDTGLASGTNAPVPPGTQNNQVQATELGIQNGYLQRQINLQNQLAQIDQQYAQKEAAFQQRLLGLAEQGLGVQEGALKRAEAEAPMLQADVQKMYQLEFAGIKQQGQDINRQYRQSLTDMASRGAATGGSFTKGMRDEHANTIADWASATASLQRQRANLQLQQNEEAINYLEKLAAFQDTQKQYDIAMQKFGIQGQEIASRLASTLQQTAIGAGENVADLFSQYAMNSAEIAGTLGPIPITQLANTPANPAQTGTSPWVGDPLNQTPQNFGQPGAGPY